jgi:hypothetical protein
MPTDHKPALEQLPAKILDTASFDMAMEAWRMLFGVFNGKAAQSMRSLGSWVADELNLHENSLDRVACTKLISGWSTKLRGRVRGALEKFPKTGMVPNPYAKHSKHPDMLNHEVVLLNAWRAVKSEVSQKLNAATNVAAATGRKDEKDVPLPPCALDLSTVTYSDEFNTRCDNVFKLFVPSASDPVATSKEDLAAIWEL